MVRFIGIVSAIVIAVGCFGQSMEFSAIQRLPIGVNTKGEESLPLFSPQSNALFFVRSFYEGNTGGRYAGQDIWVAERAGGKWKAASNKLGSINNRNNNVLTGINAGGTVIYSFSSSSTEKLQGIEFSTMQNGQWTDPEFVPFAGIENSDFIGMFVTPEFDVILFSMKAADSRGEEDLYVSTKSKSGAWSAPRNLGATINTSGFEISPFLTADRKRLYFASNGHGGLGDADIFYCDRLYNSWETWSAPVNVGNQVNSPKFDAYFSIYGDSLAFFCSNRENSLADIYSARVSARITLLAQGQQYLSQQDWIALVGKNVSPDVSFEKETSTLTAGQKELLYYMAKKISDKKDIGIHLVVKEQEDSELTRARLKELYGEFRQAGIEANRINEQQSEQSINSSTKGVIRVMLYREKPNP